MNLLEQLNSVYNKGIKKVAADLMPNEWFNHDQALDIVSKALSSSKDYELVGKLLLAFYQSGYMKFIDDNKEKLKEAGIKITLTEKPQQEQQNSSIF